MGLTLKNGYLLLDQAKEKGSEFALETKGQRYIVAVNTEEYKKGDSVYLLNGCVTIEIDGTTYSVAEASEVVAHVA